MAAYFWLVLDPVTGESFLGLNGDLKDKVFKQMAGGHCKNFVAVKKAGSDKFEVMSRTAARKCKGAEVKEIAQPKYRFGVYYT